MVVTIPTREQVPVEETWDLAPLYADEAAWEADFARVEGARDAVVARRGTIRDESGAEIELTKGRVAKILQERNRALRREAAEKMAAGYRTHQHTLASLHAAAVRKDAFYARMRGHASARDAALFEANIPTSVYDALIDAVHGTLPAFHRYLDLRRRVLAVPDELHAYDLNVPLAEIASGEIAYRDAVTTVLEGLAPLGERYVGDLQRGLASRWVDVHETVNKRSGGYNI